MWSTDRFRYRDYFYEVWRKYKAHEPVTPLESQLIHVILLHPEYHFIFENEDFKTRDFFPELGDDNPFLHLSLHIGLQEQLATNRPQGIREIYEALLQKKKDPHQVAHLMMERISEMMYRASRGTPLDDATYLEELGKIA